MSPTPPADRKRARTRSSVGAKRRQEIEQRVEVGIGRWAARAKPAPDADDAAPPGNGGGAGERVLLLPGRLEPRAGVETLEPVAIGSGSRTSAIVRVTHAAGDAPDGPPQPVIRPMPRRELMFAKPSSDVHPPMARRVVFRASIARTVGRLVVWLFGAASFIAGTLADIVRGRDSLHRRALRLRETIERLGGTFVKVGQQLSIRADLLPYAYCEELSKMLDRLPPYPTEQAIAAIERRLGRPLGETFASFDPQPIGSASLACVYQATLKTGERVAVKVRRPGIGETLAADLRALDWILSFAEAVTLLRPGFTRNLRKELHSILMGELNFRNEARFTDIFRRRARRNGLHLTSPRVYFELSSEEVLVTEFVSGVWMWELMAAVDCGDEQRLAEIRAAGIDLKVVAKRITRALHWESLENIFFHGDPHPANLVVRENNTVCFIDFGACGRFSSKIRNLWKQLHFHMIHEDVGRMVQCLIGILEPLPPIDMDRFTKALEAMNWEWMDAQKSRNAEWWERSTGQMWIKFIGIAREFNIPVNLETLQFFRATILYDSIVTRLWKDIDFSREFRRYADQAGRRARKRLRRAIRERITGLRTTDYTRIEEVVELGNHLLHRAQHTLDLPSATSFSRMIGKAAFSIAILLRVTVVVVGVTSLLAIAKMLHGNITGQVTDIAAAYKNLLSSVWYQIFALIFVLLLTRKALMRIEQVEVKVE